MAFLGETGSQNIANSKLAFLFPNGSIIHNETGVAFGCLNPMPMRVPDECSFQSLKNRVHNTLLLTNEQHIDEIYYRQPFMNTGKEIFFHSLQLKDDDNVCTMLMCHEEFSYAGPIELLCIVSRTPDGVLNLLRSTMTPTHDALLYYNGKWNIPRQGNSLGYSFTGTNPIRFEIPVGCNIATLKDIIKQVAPPGVPPYGIHESQVVRHLFFRQPGHAKYSENLVEYEIKQLKSDEDLLKVLAESNYWKRFSPIEILATFNKPVIQALEDDMSVAEHLPNYD